MLHFFPHFSSLSSIDHLCSMSAFDCAAVLNDTRDRCIKWRPCLRGDDNIGVYKLRFTERIEGGIRQSHRSAYLVDIEAKVTLR